MMYNCLLMKRSCINASVTEIRKSKLILKIYWPDYFYCIFALPAITHAIGDENENAPVNQYQCMEVE